MTDKLTPIQRHKNMVAIKSKNTKPEMVVRRWLWWHGFRYRLNHPQLLGKPDIVMRKYRTCIFVNGCFGHGHEGCRYYTIPKTNTEFWVSKVKRNKELDLTEGRSTGIPTIQNVLENNGSLRATVVTDDERTFFRITIPCHEAAGNIIADIAYKDGSLKASKRGSLKTGLQSGLESRLQTGLESALQTVPKSALKILEQIHINPQYTLTELAKQTGYSRSWVAETMKRLQEQGVIKRVGSDKTGHWEIIG